MNNKSNFFEMLKILAKRSKCLRRKTAAMMVSPDGCIISTGYNGPPRRTKHCNEEGCLRTKLDIPSGQRMDVCKAAHAEENAIIQAARHGISVNECTMYSINSPCFHCLKLIINSGISKVISKYEYFDPLAEELIKDLKNEKDYISLEIEYPFYKEKKIFNSIIIVGWIGSGKSTLKNEIVKQDPQRFKSFLEAGSNVRNMTGNNWDVFDPLFELALLHCEKITYENAYASLCEDRRIPIIEGGYIHNAILVSKRVGIERVGIVNKEVNFFHEFINQSRFWNKFLRPLYLIVENDLGDSLESSYIKDISSIFTTLKFPSLVINPDIRQYEKNELDEFLCKLLEEHISKINIKSKEE